VRTKRGISMLLILFTVAACGSVQVHSTATSSPYLITFDVSHISIDPSGETHFDLTVANDGREALPADTFVAHFELSRADGTLRSVSDVLLPRIPTSTGDLTTVVSVNAPLEPGDYDASWGVTGLGSTTVKFQVVAENGGLDTRLIGAIWYPPAHPYPASEYGQR